MDEPSFKSFERASITPGNVFRTNIISSITEEESTLQPLIVNRTKENFGNYIFIVYSKDREEIDRCLDYLKNLTKMPFKESYIDVTGETDFNTLSKDYIYIYDLTKEDTILNREISFENYFSCIFNSIYEKAGGILFIADHVNKVPRYLSTMSQLIFIGQDIDNLERIIVEGANVPVTSNLKYDLKNILCLNKTLLWTKITFI